MTANRPAVKALGEVAEIDQGIAEDFETLIKSTDWQAIDSLTGTAAGDSCYAWARTRSD